MSKVSRPLRYLILSTAALAVSLVLAAPSDQACLRCHSTVIGVGNEEGRELPAGSPAAFIGSAHRGMSCQDCHPFTLPGPHAILPTTRDCVECHRPEGGIKGYPAAPLVTQLHEGRVQHSPQCENCHGHHQIGRVDDPKSTVYWKNVPQLCATCHVNADLKDAVPQVAGYFQSVHGRIAAQGGKQRPAVCSDCHMLHKVEQQPDAAGQTTLIAPHAIREYVCGKCHAGIEKQYHASVHGQALARGVTDAPVCTDCHGEHSIQRPDTASSSVAPGNVVGTCGNCHGDMRFVRRHKLPERALSTYLQSYHGMANEYGDIEVANCASCHGSHDILPASSPLSRVNAARLPETCGKCHPGAGTTFPIGKMHVAPRMSEKNLLLLIQALYLLLILGSLGGFVAYIGLDVLAHHRLKQKGVIEQLEHRVRHLPVAPPQALVRMLPLERVQHMVLLISFFVLAITGLVLFIPNTAIGDFIVMLCGGPSGRAIIHRVAAVVMIANFVIQAMWMASTKPGRSTLRRLLPGPEDLRDVWQSFALFLGFSPHRPSFHRFGYAEKFEFWALVWGTIVMALTGLLLWFVNWTLGHAPKVVLDVATIIHKWEAILAVEAILVWHLYHVIWKPGVYPGNRAWLTGEISFEQLVMEHPLDYAEAMGWLPSKESEAPGEPAGVAGADGREGDTSERTNV